MNFSKACRLAFLRIEASDHRRRRLHGILQGAVTNLGNRVIGMAVSFLSVPLTIRYLGPEQYGAWVSIGAMLTWLQLTDFGLGNGLTNAVSAAAGQNRPDLVRMHVSNGMALLLGISGLIGLAGLAAWPFIDWSALFGLQSEAARAEIGPAVAVACLLFLAQFQLSTAGKIYLAYQEGRIGNYWGAAGNLLSLAALLVVTQTKGGLVWLVIAVSGTQTLVSVASNLWVYLVHRPQLAPHWRYIDPSSMRSLSVVGGNFFLIQNMALVTFQTDNLVIAHYLGSAHVPEYSLTATLFSYAALPQSIVFSYLWTAYTEAIARHDIDWVRRTFNLSLVGTIGFTALATIVIALVAKSFIGWWAGPAVVPGTSLILWMVAWSMINAFTNPIACLLAAASHLRAQTIYSGSASAVNLVLSIYLVHIWGVAGVIAGTVIAYGVCVCVPVYFDAELLLKRLRHAV